jgi:hypothetical protein
MRPNLTGEWTLVPGEGEFAFLGPPRLRVDTIHHEEPRLHIRTRQQDANGDITVDRIVDVGGRAEEIAIHGRARTIRAFWDQDVLVMETVTEVSGNPRRIEDRWTVDKDSAWLTIDRKHEQPGGAVHQRLRLRREPSAGGPV